MKGGILYTKVEGQASHPSSSATSTWHRIQGPSCIRFRYLGTVPVFVATLSERETGRKMVWNDTVADMTPTSWRTGQIDTEIGTKV